MKKKMSTRLPLFLLALSLLTFVPVAASEQTGSQNPAASASDSQTSLNGYVTVDGMTYYYKNG
ncbi:MAG: hypothetical protein LUF27_11005 [Lachnospiraceae bacterium]|nr:hypothetical protein [Lachnospiraceae bacterium]